jgi:hypothetical protein
MGILPTLMPAISSITPPSLPTITLLLTSTDTPTPAPDTPSGCNILSKDGKLYVLSDEVFFALGPSEEELDQALANNYPEWANYEQNVRWKTESAKLGEIVREASFQEKFVLNSEVTLVTLGESLNWQIPANTDLFLRSLDISERLNHLWFEWTNPENVQIRARYPEITNAATYAVYIFFGQDESQLQTWCNTYQRLFETPP